MGTLQSMSTFATRNPATGKPLETYRYFDEPQVNAKLQNAHERFEQWKHSSHERRSTALRAISAALRAQRDRLAEIAVAEMGKPLDQAQAEVEKCAGCCDYFAEHAQGMLSDAPLELAGTRSYAAMRAIGPVLAIMPWNFPYWQAIRALVPAIAAGNVIVLKHADNTTQCALELERIVTQATGFDGLLCTLLANHDSIGPVIADQRIAAATLTGSERAGAAVASAAGKALKKVVLELGGSDPYIVLDDADLSLAVDVCVKSRFQNNGQSCIAAKRFIVDKTRYGDFVDAFTEKTKSLTLGDPMDPETKIGPVARDDLRETLHEQVQATLSQGARLTTGGAYAPGDGFYYEPTVVAGVLPGMPMFDQETFGPAAAIIEAKDEAHAIALANASTFGLGGAVFSSDIARAEGVAATIETGMVFINAMVASNNALPFGGVKRSGHGRELISFGIHEFVNIQTVSIPT